MCEIYREKKWQISRINGYFNEICNTASYKFVLKGNNYSGRCSGSNSSFSGTHYSKEMAWISSIDSLISFSKVNAWIFAVVEFVWNFQFVDFMRKISRCTVD